MIRFIHNLAISRRRISVLSKHIANLIPPDATVLDVGCGKGDLSLAIKENNPDISIVGVDPLVRDNAVIKVQKFDGVTLPFRDNAFEYSILSDVLHHTENIFDLLRETRRVSKNGIIIKDHICSSPADLLILRIMDAVGNRGTGVTLPYNYLSLKEWNLLFQDLGLIPDVFSGTIGLYPFPLDCLFERSLHFIALAEIKDEH